MNVCCWTIFSPHPRLLKTVRQRCDNDKHLTTNVTWFGEESQRNSRVFNSFTPHIFARDRSKGEVLCEFGIL